MKKILLFIVILGVSLFGRGMDEYGRHLRNHESDGGHTISKHVGKSFNYLEARCSEGGKFYATYRYYNDAQKTLKYMILDYRNRRNIDIYQRGGGRGASGLLRDGTIRKGYHGWRARLFGYRTGTGKGVDCSKLGQTKTKCTHKWWRRHQTECVHKRLYTYSYLRVATATLGYNKYKRRWFIYTSYPKSPLK